MRSEELSQLGISNEQLEITMPPVGRIIANSIMAYMAMFRNGQDRSLQSKTLGPALTPNSYFLTPNLPFLRYYDLVIRII